MCLGRSGGEGVYTHTHIYNINCYEDRMFPFRVGSFFLSCESAKDTNRTDGTMDLQYLIKFSMITNLATHSERLGGG